MGQRNLTMLCFALFLRCSIGGGFPSVVAYKNYTVGDYLGWYDNLAKPDLDYDKWVAGKTFSLGDFLIFNTDNNHTVIQTHNVTTYNSCDSQGDDVVEWSTAQPNSTVVHPLTVAVPLLKEGATYFFSGDYDGEQCMNGQKFHINVTHGQGLPSSLRDNPDFEGLGPTPSNPAPGPTDPENSDEQSAPDTIVPTNFNHPKSIPQDNSDSDDEESDSKKSNGASFGPIRDKFLGGLIGGLLVLFWVC